CRVVLRQPRRHVDLQLVKTLYTITLVALLSTPAAADDGFFNKDFVNGTWYDGQPERPPAPAPSQAPNQGLTVGSRINADLLPKPYSGDRDVRGLRRGGLNTQNRRAAAAFEKLNQNQNPQSLDAPAAPATSSSVGTWGEKPEEKQDSAKGVSPATG